MREGPDDRTRASWERAGWEAWVFWEFFGLSGVERGPRGPDIEAAERVVVGRCREPRLEGLVGSAGGLFSTIVLADESLASAGRSEPRLCALAAFVLADPHDVGVRRIVDRARRCLGVEAPP